MEPGICFCGESIKPSDPSPPDLSEDGGWGNEIYCSRACALYDSMQALTARQVVITADGEAFGMEITDGQLSQLTHYRRVGRAASFKQSATNNKEVLDSNAPQDTSPATFQNHTIPNSTAVPGPSISPVKPSTRNPYVDKPLPELPRASTATIHATHSSHSSKRSIANRPADAHNRNSSLSSFADFARFTSQSHATRVTSVASSVDGGGVNNGLVSRSASSSSSTKGIKLSGVVEEDEGAEMTSSSPRPPVRLLGVNPAAVERKRTEEDHRGNVAGRFAGFCMRRQELNYVSEPPVASLRASAVTTEDVEDVGSHYDPFELDQLLLRTPQIQGKPSSVTSASVASFLDSPVDVTLNTHLAVGAVDISPLSLSRHRSRLNQEDTFSSTMPTKGSDPSFLAPPIESTTGNSYQILGHEVSCTVSLAQSSGLMPPVPPLHPRSLLPASPSGFPSTPSLSPFVYTPQSSPLSAPPTSSRSEINLGTGVQETSGRPVECSQANHGVERVFTLHRRRPTRMARMPKGSSPTSPIGELRLSAASEFGTTPLVGPGRPLFLEPMAGLGFDIGDSHEDDDKGTGIFAVRREPRNGKGNGGPAQRCTVFEVRDQLRRAATLNRGGGGRRGAFPEEDCLTYYFRDSDDEGDGENQDTVVILSQSTLGSVL
ncbi:hypothetical protein FRB95_013244 [Tulasnella sp. JGI-2019a]|nr:hypothetical protein FRB95_013244 [Tulasnella sp. JGI-2019a]